MNELAMFTIDASVHINALNPNESGSAVSQACLRQIIEARKPIFSPTLLLVEIAAAIARALDNQELAVELCEVIQALPGQIWVPLDEPLAKESAQLGAIARLRGADAVYAAVAQRFGTILVTLDRQQLERLDGVVVAMKPSDVLQSLT